MGHGIKCEFLFFFLPSFLPSFGYLHTRSRWLVNKRSLELRGKVNRVSNAALHWILKDASTRLGVLEAIYRCLKPNGTFVFEMGGHGNVPEVHSALLAAVIHQGATIQQARTADPWFFPSETWMRAKLEEIGFRVEKLEVEYRPTRLTADANGGLAGWVRLMGSEILDIVDADRREAAVEEVSQVLETVITREEDGSGWLGYVRLRGVAVKA